MNRLAVRLTAAFLVAAWLALGAMVVVVQRGLDAGFRQYVRTRDNTPSAELAARLEAFYAANGAWDGAEPLLKSRGAGGSGANSGRGADLLLSDATGRVLAATAAAWVGQNLSADQAATALALQVAGETVGWLARQSPAIQALGAAEEAFLATVNRWFIGAAGLTTLLALLVGVALARRLARPLHELTHAAQALQVGQLGRQVPVHGTEEITALAAEFNAMSQALAEAERLRQRMAADVAHELRTPVSVLRGHLEALLDGVYALDQAHVAVAHEQTLHLARLVEDLRVLTLAEAKRLPLERAPLDVQQVVEGLLEAFEPLALDQAVRLERTVLGSAVVLADATRLRQVLSNLLSNALRHTPSGGQISVRLERCEQEIRLSVTNTGEPLALAETERVFQPFWRAAASPERDNSGSGLGLAISREIVALHGGALQAANTAAGVCFTLTLPVSTAG